MLICPIKNTVVKDNAYLEGCIPRALHSSCYFLLLLISLAAFSFSCSKVTSLMAFSFALLPLEPKAITALVKVELSIPIDAMISCFVFFTLVIASNLAFLFWSLPSSDFWFLFLSFLSSI